MMTLPTVRLQATLPEINPLVLQGRHILVKIVFDVIFFNIFSENIFVSAIRKLTERKYLRLQNKIK